VSNVIATGAGAAVGGNAGAFEGYNVDRFNRQLHPEEKQAIKNSAEAYAKQQGITVEQAVNDLTAQANLQVQNGSPGAWNQSASTFLSQFRGMLPADGGSGPGYMFYATPDQKANASMYAGYYPNGVGPNQPSGKQIQDSANREQASRNLIGGGTIAAAMGGAVIAGAPAAVAIGGAATAVIGGTVAGGMDATAQYSQSGSIRPTQTAFAATVGAVAGPIGGGLGMVGNMFVGGLGLTTTTAFNNVYYGENSSLVYAFAVGSGFGGISYVAGLGTAKLAAFALPTFVFPKNLDPAVPAVLQGGRNAFPANLGIGAGAIAGGGSSLVPSKDVGALKK